MTARTRTTTASQSPSAVSGGSIQYIHVCNSRSAFTPAMPVQKGTTWLLCSTRIIIAFCAACRTIIRCCRYMLLYFSSPQCSACCRLGVPRLEPLARCDIHVARERAPAPVVRKSLLHLPFRCISKTSGSHPPPRVANMSD